MESGKDATIIELESVSLDFEGLEVIRNFSLKLKEGDSLVLVGPSGSGKSSVLKLMAGLLTPNSGRVLYRGNDLSTLSKKDRDRFLSEVGMLFQQNALFDSMTVFENLSFVLGEIGVEKSKKQQIKDISDMLKAVGLDHVPNLYPSEISGGMQKRLGIARALILKPRLIFYDDPTAGLDPITSRKIVSMILELKKEWGGTLVTVTNDMSRAFQLAGQCLLCLPQEIVVVGSGSEMKSSQDPRVTQFINGHIDGPLEAL